jgi:hypothetical protein
MQFTLDIFTKNTNGHKIFNFHSIYPCLTEVVRRYGIKMNVEETKVMIISSEPPQVQIVIDQKRLENVEYFNYLGSVIINDVHVKLSPRLPQQKQHSTGRRHFSTASWT